MKTTLVGGHWAECQMESYRSSETNVLSGTTLNITNTIPPDPAGNDAALAGPTVDPATAPPATTPGGDFTPIMIERFTRITNSTLFIYYTLSTWNPYCVVKMRSAFAIQPVLGSPVHTQTNFTFSWLAPTSQIYQVDYSTNLLSSWTTLTNLVTSSNGTFRFTDNGTDSGGFGTNRFYRLRAPP